MNDTRTIASEIGYYKPDSLSEALKFLDENKNVKCLAGGTDLIVDIKTGGLNPDYLMSITEIETLDHITEKENEMIIGAAAKLSRIEKSTKILNNFPILAKAAGEIGGPAVRNMGTIGGNICNASTCASTAPPLLTLNAKIKLESRKDQRTMPLEEFLTGPRKTAAQENELLTEIRIPYYNSDGSSYREIKRVSEDLGAINVGVLIKKNGEKIKDCRIGLGGVAPTPIRAKKTEKKLKGEKYSEEIIIKKSEKVKEEINPSGGEIGHRSTKEYRTTVTPRIVKDCINEAWNKKEEKQK